MHATIFQLPKEIKKNKGKNNLEKNKKIKREINQFSIGEINQSFKIKRFVAYSNKYCIEYSKKHSIEYFDEYFTEYSNNFTYVINACMKFTCEACASTRLRYIY